MSVTIAQFVARHPEFASVASSNPEMVQGALDDAESATDATVCGAQTDAVIRLRAADALARTPFGQPSTLVDDEGRTPYSISLASLVERLGLTYRTVLE